MKERVSLLRRCGGRAISVGVAARARPGFTLMEVMVAVAAVALVSVGLASILDAVGKTVSGGRRVSHLSTYAALMETQMRADFESMTRDGFLVIRQQWVDQDADGVLNAVADRVPLYADQPLAQWRGRRIDEIAFFAHGDFATMRQPVIESKIATSDTARIYYGHGQRRRVNADPSYLRPEVFDDNAGPAPLPVLGRVTNGVTPNSYASEWMLLRHATLLVNPEVTPPESPLPPIPQPLTGVPAAALRDLTRNKNLQIGAQPAAASVFRSVIAKGDIGSAVPAESVAWAEDPIAFGAEPRFSSGMTDIASTDMSEVRAFVTTFGMLPSELEATGMSLADVWKTSVGDNAIFDIEPIPAGPLPGRPGLPGTAIDRMHMWMSNALPTQSVQAAAELQGYGSLSDLGRFGVRMRYEQQPTDLLEVISNDTPTLDERDQAVARANQLMLESANFVPRCSEFIVEWSFGQVDQRPGPTNGQLLWYGLSRRTDTNRNGQIDAGDLVVVDPYPPGPYPATDAAGVNGPLRPTFVKNDDSIATHVVSDRLIYGYSPAANALSLTSHFGYVDPTFDPDDEDSAELSKPWPWPRLVRVTVTLSDPQDPAIESTFQFMFKTPDASTDTGI